MEENLFTINVTIGERLYPIVINRDEKEEEYIRSAAKLLNEMILEFKKKYPLGAESKTDTTDYLSMAALQVALKFVKLSAEKDINLFAGEIDAINKELENYLKSE
jgi:cell division protein ZapA